MKYVLLQAAIMLSRVAVSVGDLARQASTLRSMSFPELLGQIQPIDRNAIQTLANEYLNPAKGQLRIEPYQMWVMIGGAEGLRKMRHNARIICALAAYAKQWNFVEAVIVTQRIKLEEDTIRRAVARASRYGTADPRFQVRASFHAFEAIAAYHLMRARLLALYETSHVGLHPRLLKIL